MKYHLQCETTFKDTKNIKQPWCQIWILPYLEEAKVNYARYEWNKGYWIFLHSQKLERSHIVGGEQGRFVSAVSSVPPGEMTPPATRRWRRCVLVAALCFSVGAALVLPLLLGTPDRPPAGLRLSADQARLSGVAAVTPGPGPACATVEEMGRGFGGGVWGRESLRVRRIFRDHFAVHGLVSFFWFDSSFFFFVVWEYCFFLFLVMLECCIFFVWWAILVASVFVLCLDLRRRFLSWKLLISSK